MTLEFVRKLALALTAVAGWSTALHSQQVVTDPSQLEPRHISEFYSMDMPEVLVNVMKERDMVFEGFEVPQGERLVFRERAECHKSGCIVIVLSVDGDVLYDPVLFVADSAAGDAWYRDELSLSMGSIGDICVTGQFAFTC